MAINYIVERENTTPAFVSLAEAKAHLRVTYDYEDALITSIIDAAITAAENYTGIFLRHYTVTIEIGDFPESLVLEYGPLRDDSITISYYDAGNASQNYDSSNYTVVQGYGKKPELLFVGEDEFPEVYDRHDAVTFEFNIGYDTQLPETIRQAVLLTIADFYEYREDREAILNTRAMTLLRPYKKWA